MRSRRQNTDLSQYGVTHADGLLVTKCEQIRRSSLLPGKPRETRGRETRGQTGRSPVFLPKMEICIAQTPRDLQFLLIDGILPDSSENGSAASRRRC